MPKLKQVWLWSFGLTKTFQELNRMDGKRTPPRWQTTQKVHRLHARGGGGIPENNVGNELLKTIMKKTIFYLKNLFDSEIMPIFAASRSNSWLRR
jgi:hypothetical protein